MEKLDKSNEKEWELLSQAIINSMGVFTLIDSTNILLKINKIG